MPLKIPEQRVSDRRKAQRRKGTEKIWSTMGGKMFEPQSPRQGTPPLQLKDAHGALHSLYFNMRHSERRGTKPDRRKSK